MAGESQAPIEALAMRLSSHRGEGIPYRWTELCAGVATERKRLGNRRLLLIEERDHFSIDGMVCTLVLHNAFDEPGLARAYADALVEATRESGIVTRFEYERCEWSIDEGGWGIGPLLMQHRAASRAGPLHTLCTKTVTHLGSAVDRLYRHFSVIGEFEGPTVGDDLIDFFGKTDRSVLWAYLVEVGERASGAAQHAPARR